MKSPLATTGEGFQHVWVKAFWIIAAAAALSMPAQAQVGSLDDLLELMPPQDSLPAPDVPPDLPPEIPEGDPLDPDASDDVETIMPGLPEPLSEEELAEEAPDYSQLSRQAERAARLDDMFARLQAAESEASAKLIAEEIWAVWVRSGSPSVDFTLRRAAAAQARGDGATARALYDVVTELQPDFAEGWARSARLALGEEDYSRAIGDAVRALQYEPRHYYALWTMANVLERMGKADQALEAYREANRIYPELKSVKDRLETLEAQLSGGVL